MDEFEAVIGLEVHVELNTRTKIFCGCSTLFGGEPNTHTCPVCTGMPGALPVLNKKVVEHTIAVGVATNCEINTINKFDRKNYFYPDNPQNYQISQLYLPICRNGFVDIETGAGRKRIGISDIHMEEDAGKLIHDEKKGISLIDYNRSGVPLIEIVSRPDMGNAEEVIAYLEKLRLIIQYLNASDCKLNEGSMRADVNLSVKRKGSNVQGTRTEMKNLNSFKAITRAIENETKRQIELINSGGVVEMETRRWDDVKGESYIMRSKEEAKDYRYFPEPDLPPVYIDKSWVEEIKANQPEMRDEKRARYIKDFGIPKYDADIITMWVKMAEIFEKTTEICGRHKKVSNWLITETLRLLKENNLEPEDIAFSPENLARLVVLADEGIVNSNVAKEVFAEVFNNNIDPEKYIEEKGLKQDNNEDNIRKIVERVIENNPQSVKDYLEGRERALGFLVGQTMKETKGRANPALVNKILKEKITH